MQESKRSKGVKHISYLEKDFIKASSSIWLLVGLVGAGKTTFAQKLWAASPKDTIRASLDEIIQMVSFYDYEPKMSSFYIGVERASIIDGLLNGYKVIVDRTNINRKVRGQFISLVKDLRRISRDYLKFYDGKDEDFFIERCESRLIENILLEESRKKIDIYSSILKLVRNWRTKKRELELFPKESSFIKEKLIELTKMEVVSIYFDVPASLCIRRRLDDPQNILRDKVKKVDWKEVTKRMEKVFEIPDIKEDFDRIYRIDHTGKVVGKIL